jgi:hypothetical protein
VVKEASRAQSVVCPTLAHSLATLHSGLAHYRQFCGVKRAELAAARQALAQSEQVVGALRAESESLRLTLADEFKVRRFILGMCPFVLFSRHLTLAHAFLHPFTSGISI